MLGKFGKRRIIKNIAANANMPITAKVTRHPTNWPIMRPSGKPKIVASEEPMASIPRAWVFLFFGAMRMTKEAVIDQNMACANAMHIRAMSKIQKFHAIIETRCPIIKITKSLISKLLRSIFTVNSIPGNDVSNTVQA